MIIAIIDPPSHLLTVHNPPQNTDALPAHARIINETSLMLSDLQMAGCESKAITLTFTIRTSARIALFIILTNIAIFVAFP